AYQPPVAGSGNFTVSVSTDFGVNFTQIGEIINNGVAGAQEFKYPLTDFVGEDIQIMIRVHTDAGYYMIGFDEFQIGTPIIPLQHTDGIIYIKEDGAGDGSSWANATSRMQEAIDLDGVSQVWVAAGQYAVAKGGLVMKNNVAIYGGFPDSGNPTMADRQW